MSVCVKIFVLTISRSVNDSILIHVIRLLLRTTTILAK